MATELLSPRTAIRRAVCELLRSALPGWLEGLSTANIHDSLSLALGMKKLPAILVYTRDERLDEDCHADPGLRSRKLELAVEVVAGNDALTDFLCAAIEAVMDANETLNDLVQGTRLQRISVDRDSDGEKNVVAARMDFEVAYLTRPILSLPDATPRSTYPEDSSAILGISPTLAELGESKSNSQHNLQLLTSTAPFIGPGYEPHYEPTQTPRPGYD